MIHNIPQPRFEELIAARLKMEGQVEIRKNHSYVQCEQVSTHQLVTWFETHQSHSQYKDHVITTVEDRTTNKAYKIRSKYLIACDGAKSRVRSSLGVECEGEDGCTLTGSYEDPEES